MVGMSCAERSNSTHILAKRPQAAPTIVLSTLTTRPKELPTRRKDGSLKNSNGTSGNRIQTRVEVILASDGLKFDFHFMTVKVVAHHNPRAIFKHHVVVGLWVETGHIESLLQVDKLTTHSRFHKSLVRCSITLKDTFRPSSFRMRALRQGFHSCWHSSMVKSIIGIVKSASTVLRGSTRFDKFKFSSSSMLSSPV